MTNQYSLGFISKSQHFQEMRSPIYWKHLTKEKLKHPLIKEYIFENEFGYHTFKKSADTHLVQLGYQVLERTKLLNSSDIVISLKPTNEWEYMRPGATLVGWFSHLKPSLQNSINIHLFDISKAKVWIEGRQQKLLYKNAYFAGKCGVIQTFKELQRYSYSSPAIAQEERLAVVLGYGNLGRGATTELLKQGVEKVIVFTERQPINVKSKVKNVEYRQMRYDTNNTYEILPGGSREALIDGILTQADIIVNATVAADFESKWTFIPENKFNQLKLNMAFIDPVHKPGHGAYFTGTTQFQKPLKQIKKLNHFIWYNGCNAMPNYQPYEASNIISRALLSHWDELLRSIIFDRQKN
ncbi:MAG: hypothetical protein AAF208_04185 [Cyanobacteria bacterium P01_A01_bin.45]